MPATCVDKLDSFACTCSTGFKGSRCEKEIRPCLGTNNCDGNATCSHTGPGTHSCSCKRAFTSKPGALKGTICLDYDECLSSPCTNGVCKDSNNAVLALDSFSCTCTKGWTHKKSEAPCLIDVDECASSPCVPHTGDSNPSNFTSKCYDSSLNLVHNNRSLDVGIDKFKCYCPPGWTGDRCELDVEECASSLCQNGAACGDSRYYKTWKTPADVVQAGAYTCTCKPGFTGSNCEVDIDDCQPEPCQNNATCTESGTNASVLLTQFHCKCQAGWHGKLCEQDTFECQLGRSDACQNNALCYESNTALSPLPPQLNFSWVAVSKANVSRWRLQTNCSNVTSLVNVSLSVMQLRNVSNGTDNTTRLANVSIPVFITTQKTVINSTDKATRLVNFTTRATSLRNVTSCVNATFNISFTELATYYTARSTACRGRSIASADNRSCAACNISAGLVPNSQRTHCILAHRAAKLIAPIAPGARVCRCRAGHTGERCERNISCPRASFAFNGGESCNCLPGLIGAISWVGSGANNGSWSGRCVRDDCVIPSLLANAKVVFSFLKNNSFVLGQEVRYVCDAGWRGGGRSTCNTGWRQNATSLTAADACALNVRWESQAVACVDVDECASNPCKNGAVCLATTNLGSSTAPRNISAFARYHVRHQGFKRIITKFKSATEVRIDAYHCSCSGGWGGENCTSAVEYIGCQISTLTPWARTAFNYFPNATGDDGSCFLRAYPLGSSLVPVDATLRTKSKPQGRPWTVGAGGSFPLRLDLVDMYAEAPKQGVGFDELQVVAVNASGGELLAVLTPSVPTAHGRHGALFRGLRRAGRYEVQVRVDRKPVFGQDACIGSGEIDQLTFQENKICSFFYPVQLPTIEVLVGPISLQRSTALAPQTLAASGSLDAFATVVLRDTYDNVLSGHAALLRLTITSGPAGVASTIITEVKEDLPARRGHYLLPLPLSKAGVYVFDAQLEQKESARCQLDRQCFDSIKTVTVFVKPGVAVAAASTLRATGLRANESVTAVVEARDVYGNKLLKAGGYTVCASLSTVIGDNAFTGRVVSVPTTVTSGKGEYGVSWGGAAARTAGVFKLFVSLRRSNGSRALNCSTAAEDDFLRDQSLARHPYFFVKVLPAPSDPNRTVLYGGALRGGLRGGVIELYVLARDRFGNAQHASVDETGPGRLAVDVVDFALEPVKHERLHGNATTYSVGTITSAASDCAQSPCRNGARCWDRDTRRITPLHGFHCECLQNFGGARCETCVPLGHVLGPFVRWTDADGDGCSDYKSCQSNLTLKSAAYYAQYADSKGVDALMACCSCVRPDGSPSGGGFHRRRTAEALRAQVAASKAPAPAPAPAPAVLPSRGNASGSDLCTDYTNEQKSVNPAVGPWKDKIGQACTDIIAAECGATAIALKPDSSGLSANDVCCVCGGGARPPAPAQHATSVSVACQSANPCRHGGACQYAPRRWGGLEQRAVETALSAARAGLLGAPMAAVCSCVGGYGGERCELYSLCAYAPPCLHGGGCTDGAAKGGDRYVELFLSPFISLPPFLWSAPLRAGTWFIIMISAVVIAAAQSIADLWHRCRAERFGARGGGPAGKTPAEGGHTALLSVPSFLASLLTSRTQLPLCVLTWLVRRPLPGLRGQPRGGRVRGEFQRPHHDLRHRQVQGLLLVQGSQRRLPQDLPRLPGGRRGRRRRRQRPRPPRLRVDGLRRNFLQENRRQERRRVRSANHAPEHQGRRRLEQGTAADLARRRRDLPLGLVLRGHGRFDRAAHGAVRPRAAAASRQLPPRALRSRRALHRQVRCAAVDVVSAAVGDALHRQRAGRRGRIPRGRASAVRGVAHGQAAHAARPRRKHRCVRHGRGADEGVLVLEPGQVHDGCRQS